MGNIWSFLVQTLTVSAVAVLILFVKYLFTDKLPPRWQYGVWAVLAVRCLIPAPTEKYVLLPLPLWLEQLKSHAESALGSAFCEVYTPIRVSHILPRITGTPASVTDWLMVIYAAGVVLCAFRYLLSYIRLRHILRESKGASPDLREQVAGVCARYGLKSCPVVEVEGLPSPLVCGWLKPILAVPAGKMPDDKVLLHELLHLRSYDALQSVFWCALRCLHWCNPFLQYVFSCIGNDMESLCDQRVLERLEGEERRAYGAVLLSMANERYARAPGTSSASNGGRNIARRIAAIVRFKKYPRGMALVSVCIVLVLLTPVLLGSAYSSEHGTYYPSTPQEIENSLALTRLRRCTTPAGAIDTYAKGLLLENALYIATASPIAHQQEIAGGLHGITDSGSIHEDVVNLSGFHYDPGAEFENVVTAQGFEVYGLYENPDGSFDAYLVYALMGPEGDLGNSLVVPIQVSLEDGWVAREHGERIITDVPLNQMEFWSESAPWARQLRAAGQTGTVDIFCTVRAHLDNALESDNIFGWTGGFDNSLKPDARFSGYTELCNALYTCNQPQTPRKKAAFQLAAMRSVHETVEFHWDSMAGMLGSGGTSLGCMYESARVDEGWDGKLYAGGGSSYYNTDMQALLFPAAYRVGIYFDGELVEDMIATEVTQ